LIHGREAERSIASFYLPCKRHFVHLAIHAVPAICLRNAGLDISSGKAAMLFSTDLRFSLAGGLHFDEESYREICICIWEHPAGGLPGLGLEPVQRDV
jgi:hypothetical protein